MPAPRGELRDAGELGHRRGRHRALEGRARPDGARGGGRAAELAQVAPAPAPHRAGHGRKVRSLPVGPAGGSGERELSLEHLFRDVPARSSGAVTLDEFYEGSSSGESDPASQHTEDADERGADIEQFTAWLEGLKLSLIHI